MSCESSILEMSFPEFVNRFPDLARMVLFRGGFDMYQDFMSNSRYVVRMRLSDKRLEIGFPEDKCWFADK